MLHVTASSQGLQPLCHPQDLLCELLLRFQFEDPCAIFSLFSALYLHEILKNACTNNVFQ